MSASRTIKSAFKPMSAKLDPARLPEAPAVVPTPTGSPSSSSSLNGDNTETVSTPTMLVELTVEVRHLPDKLNAAWCYIPRPQLPPTTRLGVVLNTAHWPTDGALVRGDKRAIRWLFSLALLERISFERRNSYIHVIRRHLVALVLGDKWQAWQTVLWTAYRLKDHALTEPIAMLPIYGSVPEPGPHKVASLEVIGTTTHDSNQRTRPQTLSDRVD
jgi:hypothetical protein